MSEYIVKLPISGAADEFFKTHEMPDMTLYGYPLTGEIVRCRDCEYYGNSGHDDGYCYYWNTCDFGDCIRNPDDFCSRGSRKEA